MSVTGGPAEIIGTLPRSDLPSVGFNPSQRLSLTPGGRSVTFGVVKTTANLWLMDGLAAQTVRSLFKDTRRLHVARHRRPPVLG